MVESELSTGVFEAKPTPYMPKIFGVDGREMAPEDLKINDILLVYWAKPTEHKAETSVVRFEKFRGGTRFDARGIVFLSRAEFEPLSTCCYPLEDISEIRFCAHDSSASAQVFSILHSLYKENRELKSRMERSKERLLYLIS